MRCLYLEETKRQFPRTTTAERLAQHLRRVCKTFPCRYPARGRFAHDTPLHPPRLLALFSCFLNVALIIKKSPKKDHLSCNRSNISEATVSELSLPLIFTNCSGFPPARSSACLLAPFISNYLTPFVLRCQLQDFTARCKGVYPLTSYISNLPPQAII